MVKGQHDQQENFECDFQGKSLWDTPATCFHQLSVAYNKHTAVAINSPELTQVHTCTIGLKEFRVHNITTRGNAAYTLCIHPLGYWIEC